ncbi:MAG TPA: radical SAM protein, partial [Clostridia bacterium]|nr:radical SAM protein [Clostridia bacterium]
MTTLDLNKMCLTFDEDCAQLRRWCGEFGRSRARAPSYYIKTFGCQQNDHDSEIAAGILEDVGFIQGTCVEESDLVLFNTCSVRANADRRFFGHVGRLKPLKRGGEPVIGVFGCMMEQAIHRDTVTSTFPHVDFMLGAGAMQLLPCALTSILSDGQTRKGTLDLIGSGVDVFASGMPVCRKHPHRALITIMTGCNNFCSYCIVPYTRGRELSRPYGPIMEEVRAAVNKGATEIMLLGQNVNSYGNDVRRKGGEAPSFASLLKDISLIDRVEIVRYMTSHP